MWKKFFAVLPYVVLAFILFIIFAKKSEYEVRERQYKESVERYEEIIAHLDSTITFFEGSIETYKDSILLLEETKRALEKRLYNIRKESEKTFAHIISSDTDWNIRFLSEYLSEEDSF